MGPDGKSPAAGDGKMGTISGMLTSPASCRPAFPRPCSSPVASRDRLGGPQAWEPASSNAGAPGTLKGGGRCSQSLAAGAERVSRAGSGAPGCTCFPWDPQPPGRAAARRSGLGHGLPEDRLQPQQPGCLPAEQPPSRGGALVGRPGSQVRSWLRAAPGGWGGGWGGGGTCSHMGN